MLDVKVNLIILLQGSTMLSEHECSKESKRPVINQRGRYAGKQKKDKDGNLVFESVIVPDMDKLDRHSLKLMGGEIINYTTRKYRTVKQSINICKEAYKYMVGKEVPDGFKYPRDFKPNKTLLRRGMSVSSQAWNSKEKKEKLEWHLSRICESRGGQMGDYTVFDD